MIRIGFDTGALNAQMNQFIADTGRDSVKVVKDQARLFVRDLIAATPPFGKSTFTRSEESYNAQREIGTEAVERDIRKKFVSLEQFIEQRVKSPDAAAALAAAGGLGATNARTGRRKFSTRRADPAAVQAILKNMGIEMNVRTVVDPAEHQRARTRRGRVHKPRQVIILQERNLDRYVKDVQGHVGKSKAGWMKAATALAVKGIPNWIRRHLTPGIFQDDTGNRNAPALTVGNLVPWGDDFSNAPFDAAIQNRIRSMRTAAAKIVEGNYRKHGGRTFSA